MLRQAAGWRAMGRHGEAWIFLEIISFRLRCGEVSWCLARYGLVWYGEV
jgi:hypothetical protein